MIPNSIFDLFFGALQPTAPNIGKIILRFLGVQVLRVGIYLHIAPFLNLNHKQQQDLLHQPARLSGFFTINV